MKPLHPARARTMLELQSAMNSKVDPQWVQAAYPYLRAVVVEAAEAIEHHGWKWWKKQQCDMAQLQMEIIDIWHFVLSELLLREGGDISKTLSILLEMDADNSPTSKIVIANRSHEPATLSLLDKLELLIAGAALREIQLGLFKSIMQDCELDWDALFAQYTGKNVLNFFRQDHGYKEGHYQKLWLGREDNEHLVDVMAELDPNVADYPGELYRALKQRYPA